MRRDRALLTFHRCNRARIAAELRRLKKPRVCLTRHEAPMETDHDQLAPREFHIEPD